LLQRLRQDCVQEHQMIVDAVFKQKTKRFSSSSYSR